MSSGFHVRFSATTHVGRVRKLNEDSILAMPEQDVWVVSDGMGGHEGGEFASQCVVDAVAMLPPGLEPREKMQELRAAITRAHGVIRQEADRRGVTTIGATVVSLMLANGHFLCFWAGDSRLYRLRDGEIEVLTTDHSLVAEFVLSGQMTWDEADAHPQSNAITRAVGVGDELELDKIRGEVNPGDRFLLCSDGLNKYATTGMIRRILARDPIETVADALLQVALDGGGADNISIIVVDAI
ncbi:PP2C family protein-serine/threonine phosphatase [Albidovulum sediminicola]|uniref:Protein phosphatase 2C domain-containing protein n=1 Tax=Albidovulum sediminicola TaxID=2984331 RepID=A0ABT2Z080_9RHOB|nr:protein phosphatase 2C domain-containing protein [Defluviimonas sp. WL0075]MCV2864485.1 protein phosphatase 2C domain-containing protein [Defluviimonas sp. WL0075]